jgi:hypothetical protein
MRLVALLLLMLLLGRMTAIAPIWQRDSVLLRAVIGSRLLVMVILLSRSPERVVEMATAVFQPRDRRTRLNEDLRSIRARSDRADPHHTR